MRLPNKDKVAIAYTIAPKRAYAVFATTGRRAFVLAEINCGAIATVFQASQFAVFQYTLLAHIQYTPNRRVHSHPFPGSAMMVNFKR
jgi:hypothetical protein